MWSIFVGWFVTSYLTPRHCEQLFFPVRMLNAFVAFVGFKRATFSKEKVAVPRPFHITSSKEKSSSLGCLAIQFPRSGRLKPTKCFSKTMRKSNHETLQVFRVKNTKNSLFNHPHLSSISMLQQNQVKINLSVILDPISSSLCQVWVKFRLERNDNFFTNWCC